MLHFKDDTLSIIIDYKFKLSAMVLVSSVELSVLTMESLDRYE